MFQDHSQTKLLRLSETPGSSAAAVFPSFSSPQFAFSANYGKEGGSHQRECEHRGRGRRRKEGSELERKGSGRGRPSAPWEMSAIPHSLFITSRKSAQKKEQITVLNIEGPQRSRTILEREQQGGEEGVLCTSEEMKGRTNNIV